MSIWSGHHSFYTRGEAIKQETIDWTNLLSLRVWPFLEFNLLHPWTFDLCVLDMLCDIPTLFPSPTALLVLILKGMGLFPINHLPLITSKISRKLVTWHLVFCGCMNAYKFTGLMSQLNLFSVILWTVVIILSFL